ncbi:pseudouridine synthase [Wallemia mellicola]|uniref:tRNA pseudouridine synthase 1 n=1 Tax=Wallemia mellicola TaxID=1708541 RepID=A0A4T0ME98_9BASI|nr:hypothetical protein E3Q24_00682 [Wallemia mellicola]TIB78777.1 hypothetical protein E3Q23_00598 [Wallemia mellicola]TIB81481.1 pseudouridine synthase [Wallemia mellicola]TIB90441.1 pseudouridine synthase [Wallemia mellicola]TIB92199.1 pseudouridine synthase [Wallemia mellicola]
MSTNNLKREASNQAAKPNNKRAKNSRQRSDKRATKQPGQPLDDRREWTREWAGLPKSSDITQSGPKLPKRKCAVIIGFCGTGYNGMQIQPHGNVKTIEGDIFVAMIKAGVISPDNSTDPGKVRTNHSSEKTTYVFARAARTDASVHAAFNVISLKMIVDLPDTPDIVEKINEHLPNHIRIWGFVRTQNSFDARTSCDSRSYEYLLPSYVFIPPSPWSNLGKRLKSSHPFWEGVDETEDIASMMTRKRAYRIDSDTLDRARETLAQFEGSHNFWSYTIGKGFRDRSSQRFMKKLTIQDPFLVEGNEWISVRFYGQSFMLHQIRKMIFMLVNVVRTGTPASLIPTTYTDLPIVVPKAPGLGLLLEKPHFNVYNSRVKENNEHIDQNAGERINKAVEKVHKQKGKDAEAGKTDVEYPSDEQIKSETTKQINGDRRELIDFVPYEEKVEAFKHEYIYKRLRKEEVLGNVYSRWVGMIDSHEGQQLDYLNPEGVITESAIKAGKKGVKGGQNAQLDGADNSGVKATLESDDEDNYDKKALKSGELEG